MRCSSYHRNVEHGPSSIGHVLVNVEDEDKAAHGRIADIPEFKVDQEAKEQARPKDERDKVSYMLAWM